MTIRFDRVLRSTLRPLFGILPFRSSWDVCTVICTDESIYLIRTGKPVALMMNDTTPGLLGAAIRHDARAAFGEMTRMQSHIATENPAEMAAKPGTDVIPRREILRVQLRKASIVRPFEPPHIIITAGKKWDLKFEWQHTLEEIEAFVRMLELGVV